MNPDYQIDASSSERWAGWPPVNTSSSSLPVRPVLPGQDTSIHFSKVPSRNLLVVVTLGEVPQQNPAKSLRLSANGQTLKILRKSDFPEILVCELSLGPDAAPPLTIAFRGVEKTVQKALAQIASVAILDRDSGRFSPAWTSWIRAAQSLASGGKLVPWSIEDFPHSHFDGVAYLLEHHEARTGILSRKYSSAYEYFLKKGKGLGHRLPLAVGSTPLPGTAFNLVTHYREENHTLACELHELRHKGQAELAETKEENDLLLLQLHQVQEELEHHFLENRKLQESQRRLAELEKTHQDLATRHASLVKEHEAFNFDHSSLLTRHSSIVAERDALVTRHSSLTAERDAAAKEREELKANAAELAKSRQDAVAGRDTAIRERDQARTERDNVRKESDTLKKTVSDQAKRIAELESQVADQANRQKLLDAEMAKAEGQLEILKDLMRPALS